MDAPSLPPSHSIHQMVFAAAAAARRSESCVDNYLHATRNIPSVRREHLVESYQSRGKMNCVFREIEVWLVLGLSAFFLNDERKGKAVMDGYGEGGIRRGRKLISREGMREDKSSARGGTAVFNANDKLVVRLSSH